MNYPYTELDEIFSTLPESVQNFITSDDVQATLDLIVDDFKIAPQNVEDFKKHVFMLLIGKIAVVDLEDYLINTLHITSTDAEEVLEYLDATIDTTLDLLKKAVDSTSTSPETTISETTSITSSQQTPISSQPTISTSATRDMPTIPSMKDIPHSNQPVPLVPKPQIPSQTTSTFSNISSNTSFGAPIQRKPDHVLENPISFTQITPPNFIPSKPVQNQPQKVNIQTPSILDAKLSGTTTQTQEEIILNKPKSQQETSSIDFSSDPYREPPTA